MLQTNEPLSVLLISGTNREDSNTLRITNYYATELKTAFIKFKILNLVELPTNFINTDLYGKRSADFAIIQHDILNAKCIIFVVPEYNGSFPGILKLFIDAFDQHDFSGKLAGLVGLSTGKFGNLRGLDHLTAVLQYLQVDVLPYKVHIPQVHKKIDSKDGLTDSAVRAEVQNQIQIIQRTLPVHV
jgi:NAD(P)H-dependent FMN reductase